MKNFTATSFSRNKKLTFIFNEMNYMEEAALGMETFKSIREKYNLPLPIIDYDGLNVIVVFPRTIEAIKEVGDKALSQLSNDELAGYEWIKSHEEISAKEYTEQFGITTRTTSRHLAKMLKLKLIKTNGENPKSPKLRYMTT
jgi:predicted HTH transcriptional regulator